MKYAIYARVSTNLEAQDTSFDAQTRDLQNRVKVLYPELKLYKVYSDHGISGTKEERPDFQQMISDAKEHMFSVIVTKSISRFARNTKVLLNTLDELNKCDVKVIFLEENIDTSQASQKFLLTVLGALAEMESTNTKEHKRESRNIRWASGKIAMPNQLPMGYKFVDGQIVIDEEEAKTVRLIFADYLNHKSTLQIQRKLTAKNIKSKHGSPWQIMTIKRMLKNQKYVGIFIEKDKETGEEHVFECPAIISKEDFEKVQSSFKKIKMSDAQLYPLSKKIYNSNGLVTRHSIPGKPHMLDEICTGYATWGKQQFGTGENSTTWEISETWLYLMIIQAIVDDAQKRGKMHRGSFWQTFIDHIETKDDSDYQAELQAYEAQKSSLVKQKQKVINLYKQDIITLEDVTKETRRIDKSIRELVAPVPPETNVHNLNHLTAFVEAIDSDDARDHLLELFKDKETRSTLVNIFVKRIDLLDHLHVKVTLTDNQSFCYSVPKKSPLRSTFVWPKKDVSC